MDSARKPEVPGAHGITEIGVPGYHRLATIHRDAAVSSGGPGEERCASYAIRCAASQVVESGISGKNGKWTSRLDGNNAAEREIPIPAAGRSSQRKVGDKAMAQILVRAAALHVVIKLVNRQIHESGEVSIVDGVRISVVGIQRQILSHPLQARDREPMVGGVGYVIVVVNKTGADGLESAAKCPSEPWTQSC